MITKINVLGKNYNIYDKFALHDASQFAGKDTLKKAKEYADEQIDTPIKIKDIKKTVSEIHAIPSANYGDLYLETGTGTEWICIESFTNNANKAHWQMVGIEQDLATNNHVHTLTITPEHKKNIYGMGSDGSVVQGTGTKDRYTHPVFVPNEPTTIDITGFKPGSMPTFQAGKPAKWEAKVENELLTITWNTNKLSNLTGGELSHFEENFYHEGKPATHDPGTFYPNVPLEVNLPKRAAVTEYVWYGEDVTKDVSTPT